MNENGIFKPTLFIFYLYLLILLLVSKSYKKILVYFQVTFAEIIFFWFLFRNGGNKKEKNKKILVYFQVTFAEMIFFWFLFRNGGNKKEKRAPSQKDQPPTKRLPFHGRGLGSFRFPNVPPNANWSHCVVSRWRHAILLISGFGHLQLLLYQDCCGGDGGCGGSLHP